MPWKACSAMEERLRFVARLLDGEGMSDLCREFGISRKTGCKIFNRNKDEGLEALTDRSRRPVRYGKQGRVCPGYGVQIQAGTRTTASGGGKAEGKPHT